MKKQAEKLAEYREHPTVPLIMKRIKNLGVPHHVYEFISAQLTAISTKKGPQGRRWTSTSKKVALSIYYHSRKAYRLLRKLFVLPHRTTLQSILRKSKICPRFHEQVLQTIKYRVQSMAESEKDCVLCFDEMSIKSGRSYDAEHDCLEGVEDFCHLGRSKTLASHALVFMVRGISVTWKQAVGYFLSSGSAPSKNLSLLLKDCIARLSQIGLRVRAVGCDQGPTNQKLMRELNVGPNHPYFEFEGSKVHVLFDPPHLIKNVRNNLQKHDFVNGQEVYSWSDISKFYDFDKEQPVRMAPKLTDKHLTLPAFSSMKVKLATQVLSHSVAAGISSLSTAGYLPKKSQNTAKFIEDMDRLFDIFNSKSIKLKKLHIWQVPVVQSFKLTTYRKC